MNRIVKLFDLRGLKAWILVLSVGIHLLLTFLLFMILTDWMNQRGGWMENASVVLILGEFFMGYLVGIGAALLVKDDRGPSYGVLGAIGSFVLVIIFMVEVGILALIVAVSALLGGYNGGMLGERIRIGRRREDN